MEGAQGVCDVLFVFWGRSAKDEVTDREMTYYACRPSFHTALFDVSVDAQGHVFSHKRVGGFSDSLGYDKSRNHTDSLLEISRVNMAYGNPVWHNDTFSTSWYSDVIKTFAGTRFLDPSEPLPDPSYVLSLTEQVWRRSFVYMLASPEVVSYAPVEEGQRPFTGTRSITETRIFMSEAAFIVCTAIFVLYIIVAAVLYGFSVKIFLPRMPTTIGALLQFTAASRAVREYSPEIESELRFGRYIGLDRSRHIGIEYSELVMPIDPVALRATAKSGRRARRRWLGRRHNKPAQERERDGQLA